MVQICGVRNLDVMVDNLWNNFLENMKQEVNSASYNTWFKDLKLLKVEHNTMLVQVPTDFHKKWLKDNYYSLIEEVLSKLSGISYDIQFFLEEEIEMILKPEPLPVETIAPEIVTKETINTEEVWDSNLKSDLNFDNYIVGDTNRLAKMAGMAVAEEPGKIHNPLFIYGKSGLGKTHLMHAIGNFITEHTNKRVLYTTSDMFMNDYIGIANQSKGQNTIDYANNFKKKYRNVDVLIIDDIQYLVGAEKTQEEFFYTFNELHRSNKQLIISSDRSPNDLKLLEERLRSRFMWGLPVNISPPDFDLRCRIVKQKISGFNIEAKINEDVIEFIANSCPNDVRFLTGTINRLMAYTAMIVPKVIDLEFANEALNDYVNKNIYSENTIENIQKVVADFYHITVENLKGKRRTQQIANARLVGMYLCQMLTDETTSRIGRDFGGRDHATVIHARNKISNSLKVDKKLELEINEIKSKL